MTRWIRSTADCKRATPTPSIKREPSARKVAGFDNFGRHSAFSLRFRTGRVHQYGLRNIGPGSMPTKTGLTSGRCSTASMAQPRNGLHDGPIFRFQTAGNISRAADCALTDWASKTRPATREKSTTVAARVRISPARLSIDPDTRVTIPSAQRSTNSRFRTRRWCSNRNSRRLPVPVRPARLNQNQVESGGNVVASKDGSDPDTQLALFSRYRSVARFSPDLVGDLMFNA